MSQDPIHLLGHVTNLQLTCQSGQWGHLKPTWVRTPIRAHVAAGGIWSCVGCGVEGFVSGCQLGPPSVPHPVDLPNSHLLLKASMREALGETHVTMYAT